MQHHIQLFDQIVIVQIILGSTKKTCCALTGVCMDVVQRAGHAVKSSKHTTDLGVVDALTSSGCKTISDVFHLVCRQLSASLVEVSTPRGTHDGLTCYF